MAVFSQSVCGQRACWCVGRCSCSSSCFFCACARGASVHSGSSPACAGEGLPVCQSALSFFVQARQESPEQADASLHAAAVLLVLACVWHCSGPAVVVLSHGCVPAFVPCRRRRLAGGAAGGFHSGCVLVPRQATVIPRTPRCCNAGAVTVAPHQLRCNSKVHACSHARTTSSTRRTNCISTPPAAAGAFCAAAPHTPTPVTPVPYRPSRVSRDSAATPARQASSQ